MIQQTTKFLLNQRLTFLDICEITAFLGQNKETFLPSLYIFHSERGDFCTELTTQQKIHKTIRIDNNSFTFYDFRPHDALALYEEILTKTNVGQRHNINMDAEEEMEIEEEMEME